MVPSTMTVSVLAIKLMAIAKWESSDSWLLFEELSPEPEVGPPASQQSDFYGPAPQSLSSLLTSLPTAKLD